MKWKQERLYPTQPYMVLDCGNFRQRVYVQGGISHFYTCLVQKGQRLRIVPDGCVDMLFIYGDGQMHSFAAGTTLTCREHDSCAGGELFGVRFLPGLQPAFLDVPPKDLLEKYVPLEQVLSGSQDWLREMAAARTFSDRIAVFGHSQGGLIAGLLGGKHPEEIRCIALSSPGFNIGEDWKKGILNGLDPVFSIDFQTLEEPFLL